MAVTTPDPVRLELLAYELPKSAVELVLPIASLFADDEIDAGERATAAFVAERLPAIEAGGPPDETDQAMFLLDMWLSDQMDDEAFSDEFEVLVEECLALHDWGTEFGPDLEALKGALEAIQNRPAEA
jgi:hypothetical protein